MKIITQTFAYIAIFQSGINLLIPVKIRIIPALEYWNININEIKASHIERYSRNAQCEHFHGVAGT